jgi:hypothetical protein
MASRADDQQRVAAQAQQFGLQPPGMVGLGKPAR